MKRRDSLLAAYALLAGATAQAGLFDPDVSEVEVGSTTSGVLDPQTSRLLTVRTKLVGIKTTTWVGRDGRIDPTMGSMTQHLYENKYDWQTSVQRATDIWRVTAEELKEGAPLVVSLFPGASSPGQLDPETGIQVRPSEDASNEWLALFAFDPGAKTFVTVQAQDSERVPYRIAVLPAGRFRR